MGNFITTQFALHGITTLFSYDDDCLPACTAISQFALNARERMAARTAPSIIISHVYRSEPKRATHMEIAPLVYILFVHPWNQRGACHALKLCNDQFRQ